ncbi:MAG: flagellar motor protein MotB [Acetobacteraceae bacterium]|nr:flagellar motor protein MotB [Acetobacteraceae bacterium]
MARGNKADGKRPIIIKKEEVTEGGHHGGAWKVAYADFVTAMMAFFLLMWLLNATTDEQRRGLADYFSPMNPLSHGASGSGQPFGGKTPFETGEMVSDRGTMSVVEGRTNEQPTPEDAITETSMDHFVREQHEGDGAKSGAAPPNSGPPNSGTASANGMANPDAGRVDPLLRSSPDARVLALVGSKTASAQAALTRASADAAAVKAEQQRREQVAFDAAAQQIREAIQGDKLLEDIASQISIDQTPEGLRIQLLDEDKRPMFALGSAEMVDRARELLVKMTPALMKLSEPISIAGHTDATPFRSGGSSNWELSAERANATRRLLVEAGLPEGRIRSVTGNADRDLLLPADPMAAANRRIAILVLRTAGAKVAAP